MFDRMPLRWRITLLITSICAVTLLMAFGGYLTVEWYKAHQTLQDRMESNQRLLVQNAVSILSHDPKATDFGLRAASSWGFAVCSTATATPSLFHDNTLGKY